MIIYVTVVGLFRVVLEPVVLQAYHCSRQATVVMSGALEKKFLGCNHFYEAVVLQNTLSEPFMSAYFFFLPIFSECLLTDVCQ